MQRNEWKEIATEVESLWGRSAKWKNAEEAFRFAMNVPAGAARAAMEHLFMDGGAHAPSPAELLGQARKSLVHTATADEVDRFCKGNGHIYAIVLEESGIRTGICARCKFEISTAASELQTDGEREDGKFAEAPADELAVPL